MQWSKMPVHVKSMHFPTICFSTPFIFFNYMRFLMSLVLYQALGPLAGEKRNIIRAKAHFVPSFKAHLLAELPPTRRGGAAGLRTVNRDRNPPFQARVLLLLRPDPGREEAARRDGGGQPGVR